MVESSVSVFGLVGLLSLICVRGIGQRTHPRPQLCLANQSAGGVESPSVATGSLFLSR